MRTSLSILLLDGGFWASYHELWLRIIELGRPWVEQWGALAVFLGALGETFTLTGFIMPGQTVLFGAGWLAAHGSISTVPAFIAGALGAALGDLASFMLGRGAGGWLRRRYGRRLEVAGALLEREGAPLLYCYHFTAVLPKLIPAAAGACGYPLKKWLRYNTPAAAAWSTLFITAGYTAHGALNAELPLWVRLVEGAGTLLVIALLVLMMRKAGRLLRGLRQAEGEAAAVDAAPAEGAARPS